MKRKLFRFLRHRALENAMIFSLAALLYGCQTTPLPEEKVAEIKSLEIDSALRLSLEGQILYSEDEYKRDGYEYCSISITLAEQGEFRRAIRTATKALFLGERVKKRDLIAQAKRDLAYAYILAGQADNAEKYALEALDYSTRDHVAGRAYRILGDVQLRKGNPQGAIDFYNKAIAHAGNEVFVKISMANAHLANKQPARAKQILTDIGAKGKAAKLVARALGNVALMEGNHEEALAAFERAVTDTSGSDYIYHKMWAFDGAARAHLKLGDRENAVRMYRKAIEAAEQVRPVFRSEELKSGFFGEIQTVYDRAVGLLAETGHAKEAFEVSEASRARALLDLFRERVQFSTGTDAIAPSRTETVPVEKIQQALPEGAILVEYHVLSDRVLAWVVGSRRVNLNTLAFGRQELAEQIRRFRQSIISRSSQTGLLAESLYERLIRPLDLPDRDAIVFVAHGPLHYLPFQALHSGKHYLVEQRAVSYAPSANGWLQLVNRKNPERRRIIAFGNPDLGNPALDLPGAQTEVLGIQALHPKTDVYVRGQATKQRFLNEAPDGNVLHIAAHAEVDQVDPLYSVIRLTSTEEMSGDLEAHEMYRVDLSDTSLVALSACDSGLGNITKGDEIWGFTRTFLGAGSRSLLVSLWPVSDESTQQLMVKFYEALAETNGLEALHRAQVSVLTSDRYSHPFYWAPFNLIGYTDPIGGSHTAEKNAGEVETALKN